MPANDTNSKIKRLRTEALDGNLAPDSRLRAVRKLLKLGGSTRTIRISKNTCADLLKCDLSQETRVKVSSLYTRIKDGEFDNAEPDERDDPEETAAVILPTNLNLGADLADALAQRNKDVRATQTPAKFIYFPRNNRDHLIQDYADLYDLFGYRAATSIPDSFFDDPFNATPEAAGRFRRSLNPLWLKQFVEWKAGKGFVDNTIPDRTSIYFRMYIHEEESRRWSVLGTNIIPSELPVGAELRKRLLRSGELKRHEIPYAWALWFAIMLKKTDKYWVLNADTPIQYLNEFPGIEHKKSNAAEEFGLTLKMAPVIPQRQKNPGEDIQITPSTAPPMQSAQLSRPPNALNEVCSFCGGLPKSQVPDHECLP